MHAVDVIVGVIGIGVSVLVVVGIAVGGRVVGVLIGGTDVAVLMKIVVADCRVAIVVEVSPIDPIATFPQACRQNPRRHTKIKVLLTLAVYHNIFLGVPLLSHPEILPSATYFSFSLVKLLDTFILGDMNA